MDADNQNRIHIFFTIRSIKFIFYWKFVANNNNFM